MATILESVRTQRTVSMAEKRTTLLLSEASDAKIKELSQHHGWGISQTIRALIDAGWRAEFGESIEA